MMGKKGSEQKDVQVTIAAVQITEVFIPVKNRIGSPLVMNCFGADAQKKVSGDAQKQAKTGKDIPTTEVEYHRAFYRNPDVDDDARNWVPAVCFKAALESTAHKDKGFTKVLIRESIFIEDEFVEIIGAPEPFQYPVRVPAGGAGVIRTRPRFKAWKATLRVSFNSQNLSLDQVVTMLNLAGFGAGICEGRPQKTALNWGRFEVDEGSAKPTGKEGR